MANNPKIREEAKRLNPIDDVLFQVMAEDKEFCQEILRTILEDQDLIVVKHNPQRQYQNLQGRSVRLDLECVLGNKTLVNVEVQKANDDDHQRRVRYNASCITTNISDPGIKFEKIPDVIIIFITKFDIFGDGYPIYHVDRTIRETKRTVDNGMSEIYVNATVRDNSEVSELMRIFVEDSYYNDEKFPHTSKQKRYFKTDEGGLNHMCDIVEKLTEEARKEERTTSARILTETLKEVGMKTNEIIKKVQEKYNIPEKEIRMFLKKTEYKVQ